ncbi:hypothetical protein H8K90_14090 [Winogradskyella echinorum]|uniref:YiaAB two helix domain-containing protein n=1 Tax=Winogradskyella echinorum TaxID=538189 RepID=A0ABR6Y465_9FLAO|nr:inner membrane protein YiaA [Winogradskyella echinorum]MBC3847523.1 hypothetical protein [Winogradskyella echinorum]MBC5751871.1 hypothetical protein [Winogradskyella echinorum]
MNYQTTVSLKDEEKVKTKKKEKKVYNNKPTPAFIGASWTALLIGMVSYCVGLWNADMMLNEKGYYFTVLLFGLFSVISVQKAVRDKLEDIQVTEIYFGISWFTSIAAIVLLVIGLWNANLELSEKGFYGMSFTLSLFAAIAVQKNTRDVAYIDKEIASKENED